jgi:signal transduction histidine kinase
MPDLDDVRAALARVPNPIALLESLFAFAPVGLQIYEAAGRCLLVNQAFVELFGSEPPPGYNVLTDEIAAKNGVLELIHRAFAGETITTPPVWYDPRELRQVSVATGRRVAMSATFFPLFDARTGAVTHVGIAYRDLTAELTERAKAEEERDRLRAILLDFTQARLGGGLPVTRRPCEVRAVAETVVDEVRAAHPGCTIAVASAGDTAGSFDPDRVAQLLSNLLENALRFSPAEEPVRVSVKGDAAAVEIAVHNAGPAIPADERSAIFDPFRRGRQGADVRGLGLGLYIVERIAAAHGGSAFVAHSDARGTELRAVLGR